MMKKVMHLTLSDLLLIRLLSSPNQGITISEQKKSLKHFFLNPPSKEEWLYELDRLTQHGSLEKISKVRFRITPRGEKAALKILNLSSLLKPVRWQTLKNCYLIAALLELPAPINEHDRQRIATADGLRANILANTFQLSIASYPTLTEARDSLLWQQLMDTQVTQNLRKKTAFDQEERVKPFTQGSIMALFLNNLIDSERGLSWEVALKQLVAKVINARRTDLEELRIALFKIATKTSLSSDSLFNLEAFAEQIKESAHQCQTGKFGDNKIFISHVWHQMSIDGKNFGLSLDQFKHYLALANNKGLICLTHADLTYAMDRNDVLISETPFLNSVFHFIRLE